MISYGALLQKETGKNAGLYTRPQADYGVWCFLLEITYQQIISVMCCDRQVD
jgi:hypothetical protein